VYNKSGSYYILTSNSYLLQLQTKENKNVHSYTPH